MVVFNDAVTDGVLFTSHRGVQLSAEGDSAVFSETGVKQEWKVTKTTGSKMYITSNAGKQLRDNSEAGVVDLTPNQDIWEEWTIESWGLAPMDNGLVIGDKVLIKSYREDHLEDRDGTVGVHDDYADWQWWTITCPQITASASGDPHVALPHGGVADFRGQHKAIYNFLTARNLSLNVMTELADFELHPDDSLRHKDVHGSFLTQAHVVARTSTGKIVRVSYWADAISQDLHPNGFPKNEGYANGTVDDSPAFELYGIHKQNKTVDNVQLYMTWSTLHVLTPEFEIDISPHHFRLERNVVGLHHRLDVQIKPRVAEAAFKVAPHGIIGQGWDGDGKAIDGEQDLFPASGEFTTYAMAKGAIEGKPEDYKVATKYATTFKFSRFDATAAPPRNVSALVASGALNKPKAVRATSDFVGSTEATEAHM